MASPTDTSGDAALAWRLQIEDEEDSPPDWEQISADHALAMQLMSEQVTRDEDADLTSSVIDPELETKDPNPDVWRLFRQFDKRFFDGILTKNFVEVSWAPRMTSCAGLCCWNPRNGFCSIRLSQPLLRLRPRADLVETLIHEMIHAILFVTREDDNHESHGPKFHEHMRRINREGKCNITVYHSFHAEVKHYQTHIWRCNGPCRMRPPYYGYVRRAMNRKPGPNDYWWSKHAASCNGTYEKIAEPEKPAKKSKKANAKVTEVKTTVRSKDIRDMLSPPPKKTNVVTINSPDTPTASSASSKPPAQLVKQSAAQSVPTAFVPFSGVGHRLGGPIKSSTSSNGVVMAATNSGNNKRPVKSKLATTTVERVIENADLPDVIELE